MTIATDVKKSSRLTVEPIRKVKNIKSISRLLKSRPRNYLLWIRAFKPKNNRNLFT